MFVLAYNKRRNNKLAYPGDNFLVKAERVNALRKQYDAFLEEDKKRKERNEYILGRLDNMRYSATAVQIRHKPIVIGDVMPVIPLPFHRPVYRHEPFDQREVQPVPEYQINRPTPQNLQLDIPRTNLDNTALLREISKKYILIPKLRSSVVDDYVGTVGPQSLPPIAVSSPQPNTTNREDWKSKYEILDQLKRKEKGEHTDKFGDEVFPVKEKQPYLDISKKFESIIPTEDFESNKAQFQGECYDTKESASKYEHEPPEKDTVFDKPKAESEPQGVERSKISDSKIQEPNTEQTTTSSTSAVNPDPDEDQETYDGYNLQGHVLNDHAPVESVPATNIHFDNNYTTTQQYEHNVEFNSNNIQKQISDRPQDEYPVQYEQPIVSEGKYPDNENVYLDPDDYSPIQVVHTPTAGEQIHNAPASNDAPKSVEEVTEYPVEMLNVQEFTPKDGVQLIDGVNVNPKHMASDENVDPGVYESNPQTETAEETAVHQDTSEIEAFDAEQKEMFYSEDTVQYDYNQQPEEGYNQEYSVPQENAYYESPANVLQEQQYPAEINEHEESNTRYDPNYEQQYGQHEQQAYVQPEGYDQTGQEYVQQEGYDQTIQEYVKQEGYDQADQQFVQPAGYDQTDQQYVQQEGYDQTDPQYAQQEGYGQAGQYQNYEYEQQDQDTLQNIEQVLDNEQGYVDEQNYDANQVNVAKSIQQAVDQNAS